MWFGVLGALEVRADDGSPVRLAGQLRRQLLAALLCRAGRPVPASVLVSDLWGEVPPRSATKTLQSHMVRLRDDLGRDSSDLVRTDVGGYRIEVVPEKLDALRFEDLLRTSGRTDPGAELTRLGDALRLWRGDAYREFGEAAFAVAERQRLTELRASAQERRTDLGLSLGQAQELIAELETRVTAEPYRERTWEQLILALYRSGRQADALGAFRRIRDILAGDLGVDPGPALRDLEKRVLHQEDALLAEAPPAGRVTSAEPGPCPYRGLAGYSGQDGFLFVGRERLTAELAGLLAGERAVLITGPSGCGKTSLLRAGLLPSLRAGALPGSSAWRSAVLTPSVLAGALASPGDLPGDLIVLDQVEELFTALSLETRSAAVARLVMHVESGARLVLAIRGDFIEALSTVPELAALAHTTLIVRPMRDDEIRRAVVEPAVRAGYSVEPGLLEAVLDDVSGHPGVLPLLSAALVRTWENRDGSLLTLAGYRAGGGIRGALEAGAEDSFDALPESLRPVARRVLMRLATRGPTGWVRRPVHRDEFGEGDEAAALDLLVRDRLISAGRDRVELVHEALLTGWPRLRGWLDERSRVSGLLEHLAAAARTWEGTRRPASDLYRGARLNAALEWAAEHPDDLGELEVDFLAASERAAQSELAEARARADREAAGRRRLRIVVGLLAAVIVATLVASVVAVRERGEARRQAQRAASAAVIADARRLAAEALTAPDLRTALLLAVAAQRLHPSAETRSALMSALEEDGTARWRVSTLERVQWVGAPVSGTEVFASDNQGDVMRYDTATRHLLGTYPDHAGRVQAISPDGRLLVVSGSNGTLQVGDGTVRVLDAATGTTRYTLATPTPDGDTGWHTALFTGDGRHLAMLVARAHDASQAAPRLAIYDAQHLDAAPRLLALDAPGTAIATGTDTIAVSTSRHTTEVIDAESGRVLHTGPAIAHGPSTVYALSPDGSELVMGNGVGSTLTLVPIAHLGVVAHTAQVSADTTEAAFSPDGSELALGGTDGSVTVLSSATGRPVHELRGDSGNVLGLAWAGTARRPSLFSGGLDSQVVSWDVVDGSRLVQMVGPWQRSGAYGVAHGALIGLDPVPDVDGGTVSSDKLSLQRIDLATGRSESWPLGLGRHDELANDSTDADARYVLLGFWTDRTAREFELWDTRAGRRIATLSINLPNAATAYSAINQQGTLAAIATGQHRITLYRLPSFRAVRSIGVRVRAVTAARSQLAPQSFDPTGNLLVEDADPGSSRPGAPPREQMLLSVDPRTGAVVGQTSLGADGYVEAITVSPDRKRLLVADNEGNISLLELPHLRRIATAPAAAGYVFAATYSPDGRTIATTGSDGSLRLFDSATLVPIGTPIMMPSQDWVFGGYDSRDEVAGVAAGPSPDTQRRFVFSTSVTDWIRTACDIAGSGFTHAEWLRYVGDRPYRATCSAP